jgi:ribonuclease T2
MLDIMPSEKLIGHEWAKHGTCDGSAPKDYFAKARRAFETFHTPGQYQGPRGTVQVRPADYRAAVTAANPGLKTGMFALVCSGRYLSEVRLCLDKDLRPRACGRDVRDSCRAPEMIVRPLR